MLDNIVRACGTIQVTMVTYTLRKNKRSKRVRLAVYPDGRVVVTAPLCVSARTVQAFVQAKEEWVEEKLEGFRPFMEQVPARQSRAGYLKHNEAAHALAHARLAHFSALYGITYGAVSVRNQRTRWGSCSRKGNLSFNYKIALLPSDLADYVIVHELCHVQEFNHSKRFWNLVARAVPNHKALRTQLRARGASV